jgi:hypothetical protein
MTGRDDVDPKKRIRNLERKRESGIKARGNRESKCFGTGMSWRSVSGERFWERGLHGVLSTANW